MDTRRGDEPVLRVEALSTVLDTPQGPLRAVDDVSFTIAAGETLALLGESGCGKSMTALSLIGLTPAHATRVLDGRVALGGDDLLALSERELRAVRGRRIGMVFQEPMSALNPVLTVGRQLAEALAAHRSLRGRAAREAGLVLLDDVGIPDPAERWDAYPHQLSGGLKQRVVIAIALAGEPELLIADEPTTALDVTIQAQILALLARLQRERGMALLLITHDLAVVSEVADRVAVMYAGHLVETADRAALFAAPRHPYTRKLFAALPGAAQRGRRLSIIAGQVPPLTATLPACRFADRCEHAWAACFDTRPAWTSDRGAQVRCHLYDTRMAGQPLPAALPAAEPVATEAAGADAEALLDARDVAVHFPITRGVLRRTVGHVRAVDGVSLRLARGRTLALVGESGCGKTTLGRALARLLDATAGRADFDGTDLLNLRGRGLRAARRNLQMIFQDPFSSMNPRMLVGEILTEGLIAQKIGRNSADRRRIAAELLADVGLPEGALDRYPHEFSGGQRQRICIARALALEPKLLICDEPTSALDVSVQAQVLNLLARLQAERGLAYLFITHDMAVVSYLAHDIAVMYLGRIVESGPAERILRAPKHPYTQALLSATPSVDDADRRERIRLTGDLPSPANPPSGCHFHPRCPHVMDRCRREDPAARDFGDGHTARCFLY
ncbi:dipeptide ABC transporter ATP-binding protein [Salinisphaera orenii]|uniref:ABC-type dipeptide transporter n=1 Tax=Salinisphaera orenii YIM 95161 TaxID=1051139 RepID=A0A423Q668_9GAMM|nr:dipeptide ABC transporter ATP-binding protein [Salinisphaera halophila]ROO35178.1 ABC transporter ATP-binding protein [Salinisphaera halophila YIM 95161]